MSFTLLPHQSKHLGFYLNNPRCLDLSDPGTGKTPPVCVYMYHLNRSKGVKTIWAMPSSLMYKNKLELLRFSDFEEDEICVYAGTPAKRKKLRANKNYKVFICTFSAFSNEWRQIKYLQQEIACLMVDEFHLGFRGADSTRARQLAASRKFFPYFIGMTGSLVSSRLDSAYNAISFINPEYYMSHNVFLYKHALMGNFGVSAWINHDYLQNILARHSCRVSFKEVYGETEVVMQYEICEMSKKQEQMYEMCENLALIELADEVIEISSEGVNAIRCRQILACPELFELNEVSGKDKSLEIHLEAHKLSSEPLVIFGCFTRELTRIVELCKRKGLRTGLINGTVSAAKRAEVSELFKARELDVIVASAPTAGVGYNWGHVDHMIYYSTDYQDDNFTQAYKRAIRGTRVKPLLITLLGYGTKVEGRLLYLVDRKSKDCHKVDPTYQELNLYKLMREKRNDKHK